MNTQPQFITNANGDKISVILSIDDYHALMEDLEDLAAVAECKHEETIPWGTVKQELKNNGQLSD